MKTKFLLNSFTKKFYINNEEDNVPIIPLVHVQVTKEICDSNISQIQNPQKEKVMIKSKSCVSNRITPKKVIDEYFNQRHMNTMKRINTLRDIKFEKGELVTFDDSKHNSFHFNHSITQKFKDTDLPLALIQGFVGSIDIDLNLIRIYLAIAIPI